MKRIILSLFFLSITLLANAANFGSFNFSDWRLLVIVISFVVMGFSVYSILAKDDDLAEIFVYLNFYSVFQLIFSVIAMSVFSIISAVIFLIAACIFSSVEKRIANDKKPSISAAMYFTLMLIGIGILVFT